MTTSAVLLVAGAFLASAVEMVEALTIVLAMGTTRSWRSTLIGVVAALAALGVTTVLLGPLIAQVPFTVLRIVVGGLLLVFGLQWLRKAILRGSGYKALHDEELVYRTEVDAARRAGSEVRAGLDWYAFTVSFKGVFLEGLEVAFIVLTFGTAHGSIPLAAAGATAGLVIVAVTGLFIHAPLSRVPENTMKYWVGVTLTTFGIYWVGEGLHVTWPGETVALLWILAVMVLGSFALIRMLSSRRQAVLA
ncbi:MAG: hypothetical protein WBA46_01660 [Thermomicrobiales bacterium]